MLCVLLAAELAFAAPQETDVRIALRGIAEHWADPAIGSVYRTGGFIGGIGVIAPIYGPIGLDIEGGYKRMQHGDDGQDEAETGASTDHGTHPLLELVPISLLVEYRFELDESLHAFAALGPTFTAFTERHSTDAAGLGVTRGARLAAELRTGIRVDTGLVEPPAAPAPSPIDALELEVYGARRLQRPGVDGFDLSAWRGSIGLVVRL